MTGQAVDRRLLLVVTVDAEPHRQIDIPLSDRLTRDVAVTRRAVDVRTNVRRVIELHVRLFGESIHALPRQVETFRAHLGDQLDPRAIGGDRVMADHARSHARKPRYRTHRHAFVTVLGTRDFLPDVNDVRKLQRLYRLGTPAEEIIHRGSECRTRGRKDLGALPW